MSKIELIDGYFLCILPVLNETEKAYCFSTLYDSIDKINPLWIPKSQCTIIDERIYVRNWLFKELNRRQVEFLFDLYVEYEMKSKSFTELHVDNRAMEVLMFCGCDTIYDASQLSDNDILKYKGYGKQTVKKIREAIRDRKWD